ncbi:MAG: FtsK/SpoIIIE domain-containing protein [Anaerolineae bacterium]
MNFYGAQYDPDVLREIVSIELRANGLNVAVTRPKSLPQVWSLLARGAFGTKPATVKALADSIAEKTGTDAASIHQTRYGLVVVLAKPPELRRTLTAGELLRALLASGKPLGRLAVPVGLSILGEPVLLDLADPTSPHVAMLGATGSGKSALARWLLWWLSFRNGAAVQLLTYSPKVKDYRELLGCASMAHPPVQSPSEALRLLAWLVSELDRRMEAGESEPAIVAMYDEVPTLLKVAPEADAMLDRIAAAGRDAGIHLLLGSQQAGKDEASAAMANMPARLVGRVSSGTLAYVTSGKSGTDADKLLGRGDFYLVRHDAVRLQAPLLSAAEWERLPYLLEANELDLPTAVDFSQPARRGGSGWNASEVDEDQVMAAFEGGATLRAVMERFGLGYSRAKRLQDQYSEVMANG